LNDDFARDFCVNLGTTMFPREERKKRHSVEKRIEITGARNVNTRDTFDRWKRTSNFLGNLPRSFLQPLGQFKAYRRRGLAHFQFGRALQHNGEFDAVLFFNVRGERFAQAMQKSQIHKASVGRNRQPGKFQYTSRVARASEMPVW